MEVTILLIWQLLWIAGLVSLICIIIPVYSYSLPLNKKKNRWSVKKTTQFFIVIRNKFSDTIYYTYVKEIYIYIYLLKTWVITVYKGYRDEASPL